MTDWKFCLWRITDEDVGISWLVRAVDREHAIECAKADLVNELPEGFDFQPVRALEEEELTEALDLRTVGVIHDETVYRAAGFGCEDDEEGSGTLEEAMDRGGLRDVLAGSNPLPTTDYSQMEARLDALLKADGILTLGPTEDDSAIGIVRGSPTGRTMTKPKFLPFPVDLDVSREWGSDFSQKVQKAQEVLTKAMGIPKEYL